MKIVNSIKKIGILLAVAAVSFTACNKLELDPVPNEQPTPSTDPTLKELLENTEFSILKAAVDKASTFSTVPSLNVLLSQASLRHTFFAPDDAAFAASGIPSVGALAFFSPGLLDTVIRYHIIPQAIYASNISADFANFQYPCLVNPAPSVSPLLRLTTFPSKRASLGAWVNNIPIKGVDIKASNGVIHKVAALVQPPSVDLWTRIQTDPSLTYLKAAVDRADSGVAAGGRIRDAISLAANPLSIASNLTVFAPVDSAMKDFLDSSLTKAIVATLGLPYPVAHGAALGLINNFGTLLISNPASIPDIPGFPPGIGNRIAAILTPTVAKGIVAYHILPSQTTYAPPGIRVFTVNIPAAGTNVKTLLNSAVAPHPGLTIQATFVSPAPGISVVAAATVKGIANATASKLLMGLTNSDLHCINGVVHKIDQVLLPQ